MVQAVTILRNHLFFSSAAIPNLEYRLTDDQPNDTRSDISEDRDTNLIQVFVGQMSELTLK